MIHVRIQTEDALRQFERADRTFYEITGPSVHEWQPNEGVYEDSPEGIEGIVRKLNGDSAVIELLRDYRSEPHNLSLTVSTCYASFLPYPRSGEL